MNLDRTTLLQSSLGVIAFAISFAFSIFYFPKLSSTIAHKYYLYFPRQVVNWLFFWPQLALVPNGFVQDKTGVTELYFGAVAAPCAWLLWGSVALLFGWFSRKLKLLYKILLCYPTMFVLAFLFYSVLEVFGVGPCLIGL
jgi:hypothetical protein